MNESAVPSDELLVPHDPFQQPAPGSAPIRATTPVLPSWGETALLAVSATIFACVLSLFLMTNSLQLPSMPTAQNADRTPPSAALGAGKMIERAERITISTHVKNDVVNVRYFWEGPHRKIRGESLNQFASQYVPGTKPSHPSEAEMIISQQMKEDGWKLVSDREDRVYDGSEKTVRRLFYERVVDFPSPSQQVAAKPTPVPAVAMAGWFWNKK